MRRSSSRNASPAFTLNRTVCAVLFLTFSFAWLYWFQADMLALAQYGLSGGKTHYDRTVGAVIITTVLFIVQLLAYAFIRHSGRMHALTYLPSFIMLAFVSSVSYPFSWGAWRWAAPLLLAVWIVVTIGIKRADHRVDTPNENGGLFTRQLWVNLLQMAFMMLGVAAVSNTNAVDHFKAHAEVALCQSDPAEALRVGRRSQETDATLTMLRAFALSQEGKLGEQLFQYAITGNSKDLLPLPGSNAKLKMLPDSVVWQHIGFRPDTLGTRIDSIDGPYVDYRLTGFLIDRKLDAFVSHLTRYYSTDADSLPYHYREALMLYQQRIDTAFAYADSAMLNRWHDFARLDTLYPKRSERKVRQMDHHRDTYWFYYDQ